jgi:dTDP-4-dehydrorhamnose 3,5-epimerase-like enzyme
MAKPQLLTLPKVTDPRGNLTFIEELKHLPFEIARTYWIYDVPAGEVRGSHAFKKQHEAIVVLSGSVDLVIHDGTSEQRFTLGRSDSALYIPPVTWRRLENFSTNAVCLVVSSERFDESDYIRDFNVFLATPQASCSENLRTRGAIKTRELSRPPSVYDAAIIELPRIGARNGHISIIEGIKDIPFDSPRVFYIYDIPAGADRGAHAHLTCHEFLVAATGAFDVQLDDGRNKRTVRLDRPNYGLHIPPGLWAAEQSFSGGAVCLVWTSDVYVESDYIRDYDEYLEFVRSRK